MAFIRQIENITKIRIIFNTIYCILIFPKSLMARALTVNAALTGSSNEYKIDKEGQR